MHQGLERIVGVYVVETEDGPALFDCGPSSTIDALKAGLAAHGLALQDIRHLLLSHVHLDHAGAAGTLVREHPGLRVHVSPIGAPHIVDPERLERSARRLYGDAFDALWGALEPVPAENVDVVGDSAVGSRSSPRQATRRITSPTSPRTARCTRATRSACGSSRAATSSRPRHRRTSTSRAGSRRSRDRASAPGAASHSRTSASSRTPDAHVDRMREELAQAAERVRSGMSQDEFMAASRADVLASDEGDVTYYERAGPVWQTYLGLKRYWEKQAEATN